MLMMIREDSAEMTDDDDDDPGIANSAAENMLLP